MDFGLGFGVSRASSSILGPRVCKPLDQASLRGAWLTGYL